MERRQRWQWIEDDGEDVLWNCPSCGRDIHADFVGETCPACGTPVDDNEESTYPPDAGPTKRTL